MKKADIAKHYFARNPKAKYLYVTADNKGFTEEHYADAHAQRLKNREVIKFTPDGVDSKFKATDLGTQPISNAAQKVLEINPAEEQAKKDAAAELAKQDAAEEQVSLDQLSFEDLKETATGLKIDLKGLNSKAKLIAAITEVQLNNTEVVGATDAADQELP